jgi:hypothetical protein
MQLAKPTSARSEEKKSKPSCILENVKAPQTLTTDLHNSFMDRFMLRQSLLRQAVFGPAVGNAYDTAVELELVVEGGALPRRFEERADITLSVLGPSGCLSLPRSREFTGSWGPASR